MDKRYREIFNAAFDQRLYDRYQRLLKASTGAEFHFRLAETPVFIPPALREKIASSAREVMAELSDPRLIEQMTSAIPAKWNVPGMDHLPHFAQVDFAITQEEDGTPGVKLIELQGFPSLTALEVLQRDAWQDVLEDIPGLEGLEWSCWFDQSRESFLELARDAICGSSDPAEVVMLDIDPPTQKTWPDFAATQKLFGVDAASITDLSVEGRQLFRRDADGRRVPVRRIYNRVVFDELIARDVRAPFEWRDELDVTWAPHPNWYWVWSKATIPHLRSACVPETILLSELPSVPADLDRWVLKPLFSFAGGGVVIDPQSKDLEQIPEDQRDGWCIQRKIDYAPLLQTPSGAGVKVEFRCMFVRDGERMVLAQNLCRLSRGRMLGVDFNKDFDWVGGSVGLWPLSEKLKG